LDLKFGGKYLSQAKITDERLQKSLLNKIMDIMQDLK
jgi:hypothetical protein